MAITNITIANFKGVGEEVTIPLRPITLLFGANSAGKSTILQALLYLRDVLEHRHTDLDRLHISGATIDLGGFHKLVHGRDTKKSVKVGVTVTVDDDGLNTYGRAPYGDAPSGRVVSFGKLSLVCQKKRCCFLTGKLPERP